MTAAAPTRTLFPDVPRTLGSAHAPALRPEGHPRSDGDRLTLEQRISSVWEGLLAAGVADCLICGGRMERRAGDARCADCGSSLS